MTYHENCTLPEPLLEQVAEQGLDVQPDPASIRSNYAAVYIEVVA